MIDNNNKNYDKMDDNRRAMCMRIIASYRGSTDRATGVTDCPIDAIVFIGKCQRSSLSISLSHTLQNNMQHAMFGPTCNYGLIISFDQFP